MWLVNLIQLVGNREKNVGMSRIKGATIRVENPKLRKKPWTETIFHYVRYDFSQRRKGFFLTAKLWCVC